MRGAILRPGKSELLRRVATGALAGLSCMTAGAAFAATEVTPLLTTGPFNTGVPGGLIELPLFDSHIGTLTSVTISEGGSLTGSALLENEAPQPESFTFHIAGTAGVDLISSDASAAAADLKSTIFNLALTSQSYNLAKVGSGPGSNANYGPFSTNWVAAISGLPLADFQQAGGGFVPIHIDVGSFPSDAPMVVENNDVFYDELSVLATGSLQARYEYTPATIGVIPEPGAWAMMLVGVGMVGAGLRMARRKIDVALTAA